jgi:hypothetical protein
VTFKPRLDAAFPPTLITKLECFATGYRRGSAGGVRSWIARQLPQNGPGPTRTVCPTLRTHRNVPAGLAKENLSVISGRQYGRKKMFPGSLHDCWWEGLFSTVIVFRCQPCIGGNTDGCDFRVARDPGVIRTKHIYDECLGCYLQPQIRPRISGLVGQGGSFFFILTLYRKMRDSPIVIR